MRSTKLLLHPLYSSTSILRRKSYSKRMLATSQLDACCHKNGKERYTLSLFIPAKWKRQNGTMRSMTKSYLQLSWRSRFGITIATVPKSQYRLSQTTTTYVTLGQQPSSTSDKSTGPKS